LFKPKHYTFIFKCGCFKEARVVYSWLCLSIQELGFGRHC
jgi:hypothetical protein